MSKQFLSSIKQKTRTKIYSSNKENTKENTRLEPSDDKLHSEVVFVAGSCNY